jgi:hypothetical protein
MAREPLIRNSMARCLFMMSDFVVRHNYFVMDEVGSKAPISVKTT